MYWADEIAQTILKRRDRSLSDLQVKSVYRVHDYKTPSGRIHVGALRGVVIHSMVARALEVQNTKVNYAYGFDDFDPMDGFPVYLPESFRQYMGQPLCNIPSPEPGFASFGQYYAQEFIEVFHRLGIKPEIIWMSEVYKSGRLNDAVRCALDNAEVIRKLYKEISRSEKPADWYPLNVVCPSCGKIGTTRVYDWDGSEVSFICEPALVSWAQGCSYEGKVDPFDGRAKLAWKVEWAAKWATFEEDFETAGKDHMTKGGSFDIATAVTREVYRKEEPIGRAFPYEWLLVGGKKMSSSKGTGASAKEVATMLPPHLLRFFIARVKPNRHLDFEPHGMTMPLLYDEYDRAIKAYHTEPESDLAKVIQYTKEDSQLVPQYVMRFSRVAFLSQMPNIDVWSVAREEKGADLNEIEKTELQERLDYAKKWLSEYASEEYRFTLQEQLPAISLTDEQRQFLQSILNIMNQSRLSGTQLHEKIHEIKSQQGINPKEAFSVIYQIFLGKDSGPQVGWFLAALDQNFVINRLEEATRG